jgi:hypothetical protein
LFRVAGPGAGPKPCAGANRWCAKLEATISESGSGPDHWTVAWVTTESGAFIKTLRKQGPSSWSLTHWNNHCSTWWSAKGGATGSTNLDGYTSATATTYTGTNSPIILTWNCRDASNVLMTNGNYKFWVQYAEDCGSTCQGPVTASGLLWTNGPTAATNTYTDVGANITSIKVTWIPVAPSSVAPTITSAAPTGTGTVGVPYSYTCAATGTAPIKFSATNLPTGLTISTNGLISGIPSTVGTFGGTLTATNGTLPNATQAFSIVIGSVPANISGVKVQGANVVLSGSGPSNGVYTVLIATNVNQAIAQWTPLATNVIGTSGNWGFTNAITTTPPQKFYRVRLP